MDDYFWKTWREAVEKFTVLQHRASGLPDSMTTYVHAEADTGSKYEFLGQQVQIDWRNPHGPTNVLTVLNPWQTAWTTTYGSYLHISYVLEHWKPSYKTMSQMHGGDSAALVIGLNMVNGFRYDEAKDKAYYMMPKEYQDAQ